jgi:hypothetical protein
MRFLYFFGMFALAILALRGVRRAYVAYVPLGLFYFPMRVGFQLHPHPCEVTFGLQLAVYSLTNFPHIVMFAFFFIMSCAQFPKPNRSTFMWAFLAVIVMGALVEIAEGVSGSGHCRSRDLIPDAAGGLLGAVIVLLWNKLRGRRQPGPALSPEV